MKEGLLGVGVDSLPQAGLVSQQRLGHGDVAVSSGAEERGRCQVVRVGVHPTLVQEDLAKLGQVGCAGLEQQRGIMGCYTRL